MAYAGLDCVEFCDAVYSLNTFFLTYNESLCNKKDPLQIFDDWIAATGFELRSKETIVEVMKYIKVAARMPLYRHIISAEIDLIPDYKDFLYLDKEKLF